MSDANEPNEPIGEAVEDRELHGRLHGLAYRMLGSVADAEDIVQETWIRWHEHPTPAEVKNRHAWLTQVAVRLCLDRLKSARVRRERYVGPWLPDPIVDTATLRPGPDAVSELASDLSVALLLALERLSPLERAAFLLHDVFDAEWSEVAEAIDRTEDACRQLASRARTHLREERPRYKPSAEDRDRVLQAFMWAVATGDRSALTKMLSEDAVFLSDGGGIEKAALKPVLGRDRVAAMILGLYGKLNTELTDVSFEPATINELPGLIFRGVATLRTMAFDVDSAGLVRAIYLVVNPEKLRHLRRR